MPCPRRRTQLTAFWCLACAGCTSIFVGNLPYQISQSAVLDIFKPVGRSGIIRISVKAGKGFAHVEFSQTVSPFLDDPDTCLPGR